MTRKEAIEIVKETLKEQSVHPLTIGLYHEYSGEEVIKAIRVLVEIVEQEEGTGS